MHGLQRTVAVVLMAVCLPLQCALTDTISPQSTKTSPSIFLPPTHPGGSTQCADTFYQYLPGPTNFCSGVRDWERGHYQTAIEFLQLAAGWGSKGAQYMLGLIHYNGQHVPVNHSLGIAWLELADERHDNKLIASVLEASRTHATPDERQRAQRLFNTMRKRYGDKVATERAWKQFTNFRKLVAWQGSGSLGGSAGSRGCIYVTNGAGLGGYRLPGQNAMPMKAGAMVKAHNAGTGQMCVPVGVFGNALNQVAASYFHGWVGHVKVEPLQQVAPSSAPAH